MAFTVVATVITGLSLHGCCFSVAEFDGNIPMSSIFRRLLKPTLSAAIASFIFIAAFSESTIAVPRLGLSADLLNDAELSGEAVDSNPGISDSLPKDASLQSRPLQYRAGGHIMGFTPERVYVAGMGYALTEDFIGANKVQPVSDQGESGNRGGLGQPTVPLSQVTYPGLWDGITLRYEGRNEGIAESFWELSPGIEADAIQVRYNTKFDIQHDGSLRLDHPRDQGNFTLSAPVAWQVIDGDKMPVEVAFRQIDKHTLGYRLGSHDAQYGVVIDPVLHWNTFHGSIYRDEVDDIAVDADGNIYVLGWSNAFWGDPIGDPAGSVIFKLNSHGQLQWNTYPEGSMLSAITVGPEGNIYAVGSSRVTWGNPINDHSGYDKYDIEIIKLNNSGQLQWNTFHGSVKYDYIGDSGDDIVVDAEKNIYVVGTSTISWGNPINAHAGGDQYVDIVIIKLNYNGQLQWNTFHGSVFFDRGNAIDLDVNGNIYVLGESWVSWGDPISDSGGSVIFKLNSHGQLQWNTFYGRGDESSIALDVDRNIYVASGYSSVYKFDSSGQLQWDKSFGSAYSINRFTSLTSDANGNIYVVGTSGFTWGEPLNAHKRFDDFVIFKINSGGQLQWNTFYGSYGTERGGLLALDTDNNIYVVGNGWSNWGDPINEFACCGNPDFTVFRLGAADFGDAPDSYSTLHTSNGATHGPSGMMLGSLRDYEDDGQPTVNADGDDNTGINDEDGISFSALTVGETSNITVTASDVGKLYAWIDFNADGDWADGGEQILYEHSLSAGVNNLDLAIPRNAVSGETFARFRISSKSWLSYSGFASDGEVEDYKIKIAKGDQTITFNPLADKTYGDDDFWISATASSSLSVSLFSETTSVCTLSSNTVTMVRAGLCTIRAEQAGNVSYNPAPDVTQSFSINSKTLTVSGLDASDKAYDGTTVASITGVAYMNGVIGNDDVSLSGVATGAFNDANVGDNKIVTITGFYLTGSDIDNYVLSMPITATASIFKAGQSIAFGAQTDRVLGDPDFSINATADSGLEVIFSSGTQGICTVSGNTVSMVGVGICTLVASQTGNENYNAALDVQQSFEIHKTGTKILTVAGLDASSKFYDGTTVAILNGIASLSGVVGSDDVSLTGVATGEFQDAEVGDNKTAIVTGLALVGSDVGEYYLYTIITTTASIFKADQVITFDAQPDRIFGDPAFSINAIADSGLEVSFSSDTHDICTVSGNIVSLLKGGTCTLVASQVGNDNYNAALDVRQSFEVRWVLEVSVEGSGHVAGPVGIYCPDNCIEYFEDGDAFTLAAIFDEDWADGSQIWSEDCAHAGGGTVCMLEMNGNKEAKVSFSCELISLKTEAGSPIADFKEPWRCARLEAKEFEIVGPSGDVTFEVNSSVELGGGFSVGDGAKFRAIIAP